MLRAVAVITGVCALTLGAHFVVEKSGLQGTVEALVAYGAVIVIAVVAATLGAATEARRYAIAAGLMLALVAAEATALIRLAERVVVDRTEAASVIAGKLRERERAEGAAKAAQSAIPETTPRLEAAMASLERAEAAQAKATAQSGCRRQCTADMRDRVARVLAEVEAARADHIERRRKAENAAQSAETALAALPMARSPTPLADALGVAPWSIDLVVGALLSLSINGAGIFLIMFGAKGAALTSCTDTPMRTDIQVCTDTESQEARRFVNERLKSCAGTDIALCDIAADLERWSRAQGIEVPATKSVLKEMERAGLSAYVQNDMAFVRNTTFAPLLLEAS
ncbi:MAG: hypothetical protein RIC14_01225 [Filomicrobium sp.]